MHDPGHSARVSRGKETVVIDGLGVGLGLGLGV